LSLVLALFFGGAKLGASVSRGGGRCVRDWLNYESAHQEHREIIAGVSHDSAAHIVSPH